MVLIPANITKEKKANPNKLNPDGSITVNGDVFNVGDKFAFVCIRKAHTPWGKMFRDATITKIEINDGKAMVSIDGLSDWKHATDVCNLMNIV